MYEELETLIDLIDAGVALVNKTEIPGKQVVVLMFNPTDPDSVKVAVANVTEYLNQP